MKITVKAPATSANLGSAFDAGGMAFKLYNEISFKTSDSFKISGCEERYANDKNLAYLAYKSVLAEIGKEGEVEIEFIKTAVPLTRGLGSSASLIVAGAYSANELNGKKLSEEELLKVCAKIEGHPDNVAPALFGGLCVSVCNGKNAFFVKKRVSDKLYFTALIPEFKVSTKDARKVLPFKVPFKSATYNLARATLIPEAFESGNLELIEEVTKDRLHQSYRKKLFKNAGEVEKLAREVGARAFFVSGAGPTHIAVSDREIASELNERLKTLANGWTATTLEADNDGITEIK